MPTTPTDSRTGVTPAHVIADAVEAMLAERFGADVHVAIPSVRSVVIDEAAPDGGVTRELLRVPHVRAAIVAAGLPAQEREHATVTTTPGGGVLLAW